MTTANPIPPPALSLWGKYGDLGLLGGASILAFVIVSLFPAIFREIGSRPDQMLLLNAVISYPHIIASFFLFYGRGGNSRTHPISAWILPLLLAVALTYCVRAESAQPLLFFAQLGFIYFFWHFLMQGVGCSLWLLGPRADAVTRTIFRRTTFGTALIIAIAGWLSLHQVGATENIFALPLPPLPVSAMWRTPLVLTSSLTVITYAGYLTTLVSRMGWSAVVGAFLPILSLALWFSPLMVGSPYRVLIQFLHGLQFLAFFRRTQVVQTPTSAVRLPFVWIGCALFGVALFAWIPANIETALGVGQPGATGRIVAAFAIFLNVHHYIVDGTLWRLSEVQNRRRLGFGV